MLVACLDGQRIVARRGLDKSAYQCPLCGSPAVLHQGQAGRIAHFKHKPGAQCTWSVGETLAHLDGKMLLLDEFRRRGLSAEVEFTFDTLPGDRRADVVVWAPRNTVFAFELQHSPIDPLSLAARIAAYERIGLRQFWLPMIDGKLFSRARPIDNGLLLERYLPRPYVLLLHRLYGGDLWMYQPDARAFWLAKLTPHMTFKEHRTYYGDGGEEISSGGYEEPAKLLKDLTLIGPYDIKDLTVKRRRASSFRRGKIHWPSVVIAYFDPVKQLGNLGGEPSMIAAKLIK